MSVPVVVLRPREATLPQQSQHGGSNFPSPQAEEHESEGEDTACEVCRHRDRAESTVLCDCCDHGFHLQCLTPPLAALPAGYFFCAACAPESEGKECEDEVEAGAAPRAAKAPKRQRTDAAPRQSAFRGVRWDTVKWKAKLSLGGKGKSLGAFNDEHEAARAYDTEARKHFTEETLQMQSKYGTFNFPAGERGAIKDAAAPTSSTYRGVGWHSRSSKWTAQLRLGGKSKTLGYFSDEEEAARTYDAEARKHYTEETLPAQSTRPVRWLQLPIGRGPAAAPCEQPAATAEAQAQGCGAAQAGSAARAGRAIGRARRVLYLPRPARERAARSDLAVQRPGRLALPVPRRMPRGGGSAQGGVPAVPHQVTRHTLLAVVRAQPRIDR